MLTLPYSRIRALPFYISSLRLRVAPYRRQKPPMAILSERGVSFDEAKRDLTLEHRGLDFADAGTIFEGPRFTLADKRRDYGEDRSITFGLAAGRMVVIVWTMRAGVPHIISMRKANEREQARYRSRLD